MKKRILSLALVVVMVALVAAGSMAYFTDSESATNHITMGDVKITQHELARTDSGLVTFDASALKMIPSNLDAPVYGDANLAHETINGMRTAFLNPENTDTTNVVDKIVQVQNTGTVDAYVGTLFAVEDTNDVSTNFHFQCGGYKWQSMKDANGKLIQIMKDNTVYTVGCFVYTGKVAPQGYATPGLTQVIMDKDATEESVKVAGDTYDIVCVSFGVQADGFDSADDAVKAAFGIEKRDDGRYQATATALAEFFPGYTIGYYDQGFVAYSN